jgi:heat-inducible transcriptional repressor
MVEFPDSISDEQAGVLRTAINTALAGQQMAEAPDQIATLLESASPELRPAMTTLSTVLLETLVEKREERIMLAGTANLTRSTVDFPGTLRPVLEALEEQMVLLKLIGEVDSPSAFRVLIGDENQVEGLRGTSVVTAGYGTGSTALAGLGVLGPTRMDYPGTISAVRAVARYVGDLLAGN